MSVDPAAVADRRIVTGGTLRCSIGNEGPRLVVEVDPQIAILARSLIPKSLGAQQPRHPPHITVVRKESVDVEHSKWHFLDGIRMAFSYDTQIEYDDTYFWYPVYSDGLIFIRKSLGLPETTEYTRPPDGSSPFHITVANRKNTK